MFDGVKNYKWGGYMLQMGGSKTTNGGSKTTLVLTMLFLLCYTILEVIKMQAPSSPKAIYDASKKQEKQYYSLVKKSNVAIRKARYSLSLQQQKVLCYLISELKETDTHETEKVFDIKAFYDFMEVGNKDYDKVRLALKALSDKSWWIKADNGEDVLVRFLNTVHADKRSAKVRIKFHEDMLPFLQHLRTEYTQYKLWYTMTMHSEYSLRLYELLKSVARKETWYFEIAELKRIFMCENYKNFTNFMNRTIKPAVAEINEKTDITVTYELFKDGNTYIGIEFFIEDKNIDDRLNADKLIRAELDGNQLTFDDMKGIEQE